MPKILSHTPAWLSRPSTGFQLFQPGGKARIQGGPTNGAKSSDYGGQRRLTVQRGTELFFVVDNEIRWTDLVLLKDAAGDARTSSDNVGTEELEQYGRVRMDISTLFGVANGMVAQTLKTSVAGQIRQLVISPLGDYLAIVTSHTVHVAVLPSSFDGPNTGAVRVRTFQLGPTAHVLEQAPVASVLWHPLGSLGSCLVTVTTDACVRLWELNRESRHSFDEPSLALDLKKLANATSSGEDLRASVYGTSKGFSPDSVEMEVAAACFGGIGSSDEHGWSAMTLWVAMTEGDVYALCPLLPSKWQPALSTIPSLSTAVVSKAAFIEDDSSVSEQDRRTVTQQQKWLSDIDDQEPALLPLPEGFEEVEVYNRPSNPPAIPKLQGPFHLSPEPDFCEITDLLVIGPRVDDDSLLDDEQSEVSSDRTGLSIGIICLLTQQGQVHICLDLGGVEAKWLPTRRKTFQQSLEREEEVLDLLLLETADLAPASSKDTVQWPIFTKAVSDRYTATEPLYARDPEGRYAFYVTLDTGVYSLSLSPWIPNLEDELNGMSESGAAFRIGVLYESEKTRVEELIVFNTEGNKQDGPVSACISIIDSDLSHFVLATYHNQPHAAILDIPVGDNDNMYESFAPDTKPLSLPAPEVREAYQPAPIFYSHSALPSFHDGLTQSNSSRLNLKNQVRLSPATLQLLTDAHRILSDETNKLSLAAADLFRRCQRMRAELAEQIRKVDEIANRVDGVTGDDNDDQDGTVTGKQKIESRMENARSKGQDLQQRVDVLRRKMATGLAGGKELSRREEAWAAEVVALDRGLGEGKDSGDKNGDEGEGAGSDGDGTPVAGSLQSRFDAVETLQKDLVERAKSSTTTTARDGAQDGTQNGGEEDRSFRASVSSGFRKQKLAQVMQLLERETALVDAVTERLGKLGGLAR